MSDGPMKRFAVNASDDKPVPFAVDVTMLGPDGDTTTVTHEFAAIPNAPAGYLMDFTSAAKGDLEDAGALIIAAEVILSFVRGVLIDADVARFDALIHDKAAQIPIETLGEISMWLVEELSGHPTQPPSASPDGR